MNYTFVYLKLYNFYVIGIAFALSIKYDITNFHTKSITKRISETIFSCILCNSIVCPILSASAQIEEYVTSPYDTYSSTYDFIDSGFVTSALGINKLRQKTATFASGNILEVAVGTGIQLEFYNWENVKSYVGIDMSKGMLSEANKRVQILQKKYYEIPIDLRQMDAQKLEFDKKFDTVIDTFSLCVISDPENALSEMARVITEDGKIVLLENSRSDVKVLGFLQDILEPLVTPISKNCKWNIDIDTISSKIGLIKDNTKSMKSQLGTISLGVYKLPKLK